MFVTRTTGYPALGKQQEFRAIFEEWIKGQQAQGVRISLAVQLFSEGVAYVSNARFDTLADYEKRRAKLLTDDKYLAVVAKLGAISRSPAKNELFEVLVPIPG